MPDGGTELQKKLQHFESELDVDQVGAGPYGPSILGYGEVSTVLQFDDPDLAGHAFKRMALFETDEELAHVAEMYDRYHALLADHGVATPPHAHVAVRGRNGHPVLYLVQEKVAAGSLCHQLIHRVSEADACRLLEAILALEHAVYARHGEAALQVGIDGQLSNFAVTGTDTGTTELPAELRLVYLDTSTAMIRRDGRDLLDIRLFLRVMPFFLRGIVQRFFLADTIDKYFHFRGIVLDLIANLHKEQCPQLVAPFIETANRFFVRQCPDLAPFTEREVSRYYREDAFTWELVSRLRGLEHWLLTRVLRRPYPHIRPGPVQR